MPKPNNTNVPIEITWEREALAARPYEVRHPDAESGAPTFATWEEAVSAQVKWNKEIPGHRAGKRRSLTTFFQPR